MAPQKRLLRHRDSGPTSHFSIGRPALVLLAAAAVTLGGMSAHPVVLHASGTTVQVADGGGNSASIGPCWGCGN